MSTMSIHNTSSQIYVGRQMIKANKTMTKAMQQLSSGYRINAAEDGPADLIQSEKLRSQIAGLEKAIQNTRTNRDVMGVAEGGLSSAQAIIQNMRQYALHALNSGVTSADEIAADQAQIDAGMAALDRIFATTSYGGQKLLDNIASQYGLTGGDISSLVGMINNNTDTFSGYGSASVVSTPNQYASNLLSQLQSGQQVNTLDGSNAPGLVNSSLIDANGNLTADATFSVNQASDGTSSVNFSAGTSLADILQNLKSQTIPDADRAVLDQEIADLRTQLGREPTASEIQMSRANSDSGAGVSVSSRALAYLQGVDDATGTGMLSSVLGSQSLGSDGSLLSQLNNRDRAILNLANSLNNLNADSLGGVTLGSHFGATDGTSYSLADIRSGGSASLANNAEATLRVLDQANKGIAAERALLGATQTYTCDAMENVFMAQVEALQKTESDLRDTDMAKAMVEFTQSQVLLQVGTQMMGAANKNMQTLIDFFA